MVKNLVKISPVDLEIALLKGLFNKKLTQAEHYGPRTCMPRGRNNNNEVLLLGYY